MFIALSLFLSACAHTALARTCRNAVGNQYQCDRYGNQTTAQRIIIGVAVAIGCLIILGAMAMFYRSGRRRNRNLVYIHQPDNPQYQPPLPQQGSRPSEFKSGDVHTQEQRQYGRNTDGLSYPPKAYAAPPEIQRQYPPPYSQV